MSYKKGLSMKTVSLLLAAVLLVGMTIGGTLAWIIDGTVQVINTFTYGDINITLTETDTGLDGDGDGRTNSYKLVPDTTVAKNPVVTVLAGSEPSWIFVKLEKSGGTAAYDFSDYLTYTVGTANSDDPANPIRWTELTGHGLGEDTEVYYIELPAETAADTAYHVLEGDQVMVLNTVTKDMIQALGTGSSASPKLTITAYAVQHDEIPTAAEAWALAAVQTPNNNPSPGTPAASTWDGTAQDIGWYSAAETSYTLDTAADLAGLAKLVNEGTDFTGKTITLTADMDLQNHPWTPIGNEDTDKYFNGTFDGSNKTISGLYAEGDDYVGLFRAVKDAVIKNPTVDGTVSGRNPGGIAARIEGATTIFGCINSVDVIGIDKAGGIAANVTNAAGKTTIKNCINNGTIFCTGENGGAAAIIGYVNKDAVLDILNCTNNGDVTGPAEPAGNHNTGVAIGTAADGSSGTIENVSNNGTVTGHNFVGDSLNRYIADGTTVIAGFCGGPASWSYN